MFYNIVLKLHPCLKPERNSVFLQICYQECNMSS